MKALKPDAYAGSNSGIVRYAGAKRQLIQTLTYPSGEVLTTGYNTAWQPQRLASNWFGYLVSSATHTALDQPDSWTFGNGLTQDWSYTSPMQRLSTLKLGTGSPASRFDRSYGYDPAGNVTGITDNRSAANSQVFGYDARDRLTCWKLNSAGCTQSYAYDAIGNLTSKAGVTATYGATGSGSGSGPHQARNVGGAAYAYDANGNLTSGGGRTATWTADNLPATVTSGGVTESYSYDADGERVRRTAGTGTTLYFQGLWEERTDGWWHSRYTFNGQIIGQHDNWTGGTVTYLHGDHLGSVSLATTSSGALDSQQEFDPWGQVRTGGVGATSLNYTGQRLDGTGLLYYHARYYDPALGRFLSADSVVPGMPRAAWTAWRSRA
jgi:RHS repeat-associated protein